MSRVKSSLICISVLFATMLAGCGDEATIPIASGTGPSPKLPPPNATLFPTVNIAPAKGWPRGINPQAADGLAVSAFAANLDHPRTLYVLPNGDVLVAETNAPKRAETASGVRGWAIGIVQKRAGAGVPSANRITLLRGLQPDGTAQLRTVFLDGLNSPFGMTLVGEEFFVANTDAVLKFQYRDGQTEIRTPGTKVADLPAGPLNHHWTKDMTASRDGSRLFVSVGSNSNVAENGMEKEDMRAAVLEIEPSSGKTRVFASGLRNANGLTLRPNSDELWAVVNERDELGSDLVPDYMTSVKDGAFYGWPYSYYGSHVDTRVQPPRPDLVAKAISPDYALGAHTASLGLAFYEEQALPKRYFGGAFIGQHGSWNRRPHSGYKVIFVPFAEGRPSGPPEDVLTGFLSADGYALGRPVGVAIDRAGALLVADDVGNVIWRVTAEPERHSRTQR